MSTDLIALQEKLRQELAAQRSSMPPSTARRISTKGKKFTLPDGTTNDGPLSAIILDWRWRNTLFEGVYNPNNIKPPICHASGKIQGALEPAPDSDKIQSDDCAGCAKNQWGSSTVGKGKACKNSVVLAIVPSNPTEDMPPWLLEVAPTGLNNFINYVNTLQGSLGLMPVQVTTHIDFSPGVDYPLLVFSGLDPHDHLVLALNMRTNAQAVLGE